MSDVRKALVRVALAGNPNSGKTSLFNAMTGAHHKVGNYPGVTVERREGSRKRAGREYRFIDLPGIYSLTAYSEDEVVTRDFLLDQAPDIVVDVLDSTNLERHLYLSLQFQELGIPMVGALNMTDEAEAKGIRVDEKKLSGLLGMPFVKTSGAKGVGLDALLDAIDAAVDSGGKVAADARDRLPSYGSELDSLLAGLQSALAADSGFASRYPLRWFAVKLLEADGNAAARLEGRADARAVRALAEKSASWIGKHFGRPPEIVVSERRYGYIRGAVAEAVETGPPRGAGLTEALDRIAMNRFLALPIFLFILWAMFQLTFTLGAYPMAWLDAFFSWLSRSLHGALPPGPLRELLVDGVIAGVGGVLSFVPLIVILFFLLSLLEDSGYMSRAAFATDRILHSFGLHGQSVFPMMLGFGCSVPAIMAARTLKSRRDRIVTVLVIPFLSCGAKLPVYVLLAAAFFPKNPSAAVMAVYAVGVALALGSAWLLKRTVLSGDPTPFVMELPPYRAPSLRGIIWHVWEKTWGYVKKAGTVILAASVLVWAMTTFPQAKAPEGRSLDAAAALERSYAGRFGKLIEPAFKPLGFDWKVAVATLTGFAAKEVVVSTLGVLYRAAPADSGASLRSRLASDPGFSPLTAFCLMLFILAIPPCLAALAAIKSEIGWRWLGFSFLFMLATGWLLAFAARSLGSLLGGML
jgi:ferrous iron transport protein B